MDDLARAEHETVLACQRRKAAPAHRTFESKLVIRANRSLPWLSDGEHGAQAATSRPASAAQWRGHSPEGREGEVPKVDTVFHERLEIVQREQPGRVGGGAWRRHHADSVRA